MNTQNMTEEQVKELKEKISKMSPEELRDFQKSQCIFCKIISGEIPSSKLYEDDSCIAILDINPANEGHILLIPKEHYQVSPQIPDELMAKLSLATKKISKACLKGLKAAGTNIFMANGPVAGQKSQHFMIHIVPRYDDDGLTCFNLNRAEIDKAQLKEMADNIKKYISGILQKPIEVEKGAEAESKDSVQNESDDEVNEDSDKEDTKEESEDEIKNDDLNLESENENKKTSLDNIGQLLDNKKNKKVKKEKKETPKPKSKVITPKKKPSLDDIANLFT